MISTCKIQYAVINGIEIQLNGIRPLVKAALLNLQNEGYCYIYVTRGSGSRTSYEYIGQDVLSVLRKHHLYDCITWRNIAPRGGKWGEQYVLQKMEEPAI